MSKTPREKEGNNTTEDNEAEVSISECVKASDYYFGLIPKADIEPLLKREGDFIARKTEHTPGVIVLALSVRYENSIRHFLINQDQVSTFASNLIKVSFRTEASTSNNITKVLWRNSSNGIEALRRLYPLRLLHACVARFHVR
jgi:hypothetical protein